LTEATKIISAKYTHTQTQLCLKNYNESMAQQQP